MTAIAPRSGGGGDTIAAMTSDPQAWRIAVDTGGTFTDAIGIDPNGRHHRAKILSTSALRGRVASVRDDGSVRVEAAWHACDDLIRGFVFHVLDRGHSPLRVRSYHAADGVVAFDAPPGEVMLRAGDAFEVRSDEEAPVLAARLLTATPAGEDLPAMSMRLATTRGTNALLERRGAEIALFITEGLGDLLTIGDQRRDDLFALNITRPKPLPAMVCEVPHRLDRDGQVMAATDEQAVRDAAKRCLDAGVTTAAVSLLHGYRNGEAEHHVAELLRDAGFAHVSVSSDLSPTIGLLDRTQTTVVDAYLSPVIDSYLSRVEQGVGAESLHVMTSAGGLVRANRYHAKDCLLSGPAGGAAGAAAAGRTVRSERIIGFDMGGTSTDVCRFDGDFEYQFEQTIGDIRIAAPALAIETVAAGGGSICDWKHGALHVGPRSAGADPGPACYGRGGPLTLTDVNLLLNRLDPDRFEIPIDRRASEDALAALIERITGETGEPINRDTLLDGFLQLADERMADAIAGISLRRGIDPSEYTLVSFGGAGGQHACRIAERLNVRAVVMPPDASLLSAVGLHDAVIERFAERQVLERLTVLGDRFSAMLDELARQARIEVEEEGVAAHAVIVRRRIAMLRLLGQDTALPIECVEGETADMLAEQFARKYEQTYGHAPPDKPIEIESLRAVASEQPRQPLIGEGNDIFMHRAPTDRVAAWFSGGWRMAGVHDREQLTVGHDFYGPAVVTDRRSMFLVEQNWKASVIADGSLRLVRKDPSSTIEQERAVATPAPGRGEGGAERSAIVQRDLFMHRFTAIARQMGQVLQRTAISTNVKQRMDYSCALLDPDGRLLVNAPHIPVHLGAIGQCVRAVRDEAIIQPGDVIVTNHPAYGGSHLPDVTVITPIFADGADASGASVLLGYAANRAHHAEIGGVSPGSMPPRATSLAEEGVVIEPTHLIRAGRPGFEQVRSLLTEAAYPTRAIDDNLADLQAAVAANQCAVDAVKRLASQYGPDEVRRQMELIFDRAVNLARESISRLSDQPMQAEELLDDGSRLAARLDKRGDRLVIDFAGTSEQHPGNLNATPAIVTSAVLYVLRTGIGEAVPLNEGILESVDLNVPPGTMLNPSFTNDPRTSPAVVGGNTETSQRLVDTLFKAIGVVACSQGTMNNVLFGSEAFGYYETIGGGAGAGPDFSGAHAVHTHMTNTAATDPEVLEHRYPVRLHRFAVRAGSGGRGRHAGGDGVVREIEFLEPMELSVLSQHRRVAPYGMEGGGDGQPGRQRIIRQNGTVEELAGIDGCDVSAGDRLVIETPGGGAWQPPM